MTTAKSSVPLILLESGTWTSACHQSQTTLTTSWKKSSWRENSPHTSHQSTIDWYTRLRNAIR